MIEALIMQAPMSLHAPWHTGGMSKIGNLILSSWLSSISVTTTHNSTRADYNPSISSTHSSLLQEMNSSATLSKNMNLPIWRHHHRQHAESVKEMFFCEERIISKLIWTVNMDNPKIRSWSLAIGESAIIVSQSRDFEANDLRSTRRKCDDIASNTVNTVSSNQQNSMVHPKKKTHQKLTEQIYYNPNPPKCMSITVNAIYHHLISSIHSTHPGLTSRSGVGFHWIWKIILSRLNSPG